MFNTSLKSKLFITVMIILGITSFVSCEKEESPIVPNHKISKYSITKPNWILKEKGVTKDGNIGNVYVNINNSKEFLFVITSISKLSTGTCDKIYEKDNSTETVTCSGDGSTCSISVSKQGDVTISTVCK